MSEKLTRQHIDNEGEHNKSSSIEVIEDNPNKIYETINRSWYEGQGPDGWVVDRTNVITDGVDIINKQEIDQKTTKEYHDVSNAKYVILYESRTMIFESVGEEKLSDSITIHIDKEKTTEWDVARCLKFEADLFEELAGRLANNLDDATNIFHKF